MMSVPRPSVRVLALTALLGVPGLSQAGYYYTTAVGNGHGLTIKSASGGNIVSVTPVHSQYTSPYGPLPIDGSATTVQIYDFSATSFAGFSESIGSNLAIGSLNITDGTQYGSLSIVGYVGGTLGPGVSNVTFQLYQYTSSIQLNGDTYTLSNLVYTPPTTNGPDGSLTGTLVAVPSSSVPEPNSLALVGLGGIGVLATRRFRRDGTGPGRGGRPGTDPVAGSGGRRSRWRL